MLYAILKKVLPDFLFVKQLNQSYTNDEERKESDMAVMDEFKSERESVKNEPFKKKAAYFWTYYKWFVIIPLIIIIGITSYIYHIVTDTDTVLNVIYG